MKVSEALDKGIIPIQYLGVFPTTCKCGAEIEISDSLTKMWCPSEKCEWKQIARMNKMLTAFGVKNVGEAYCRMLWNVMKECGMSNSHVEVFNLPFTSYPDYNSNSVTLEIYRRIQKVVLDSHLGSGYSLGDLVSKLCLPGLDINARKLFFGFNNVKEMQVYSRMKYGQYGLGDFVKSRFGYGIMSRKVIHTLAEFGEDIELAESIFKVKKAVSNEIRVAITGRVSVAGSFTRKKFLDYCNELCDGCAEVLNVNPSSSIQFVIADDESDSSTYYYGEEHGILIDSGSFVDWLKSEVIGCE